MAERFQMNGMTPVGAELDLFPGYTHSDPRFLDEANTERRFAFFDKHLK